MAPVCLLHCNKCPLWECDSFLCCPAHSFSLISEFSVKLSNLTGGRYVWQRGRPRVSQTATQTQTHSKKKYRLSGRCLLSKAARLWKVPHSSALNHVAMGGVAVWRANDLTFVYKLLDWDCWPRWFPDKLGRWSSATKPHSGMPPWATADVINESVQFCIIVIYLCWISDFCSSFLVNEFLRRDSRSFFALKLYFLFFFWWNLYWTHA